MKYPKGVKGVKCNNYVSPTAKPKESKIAKKITNNMFGRSSK